MKYEDAEDLLYQTKWKTETCSQGAQCWCRMVVPVKPIVYDDCNSDGLYVAGSGALNKRSAEYFVKLHNNELKKQYPLTTNPDSFIKMQCHERRMCWSLRRRRNKCQIIIF